MSEENKTQQAQDIIEVEWEEIKPVVELRANLLDTERTLASLLLQFEKQKSKLLARAEQLEESLQVVGANLRDSKGIDGTYTYELKVPNDPGDKGYFIRKT